MALIERYSADAVRYWAASTGFGRDAVISEEKVQNGSRLVTKLWNVARFSERFLAGVQACEKCLPCSHPRIAGSWRGWMRSSGKRPRSFDAYDYSGRPR